jgi:hypothetical protein
VCVVVALEDTSSSLFEAPAGHSAHTLIEQSIDLTFPEASHLTKLSDQQTCQK